MFVHGLWIAAAAWDPWVALFEERGYAPIAPAWPGEAGSVAQTRAEPQAQAPYGITEIADHFAAIAATFPAKPIVIGHSFGGLIAQNLVTRSLAVAAVAIDPAQIKGVKPLPIAQLRSAFPVLKNPGNRKRAVALTESQFRYGFGNALSVEESAQLYNLWNIPSPARPLFQAAVANFAPHSAANIDTHTGNRGPLLLISGSEDHTVPAVVTRAAHKLYRHSSATTDYRQIEGRGHSLTIDSGWREVADVALSWLAEQGLAPVEP
jgi:pimeloyl-ACP methyl ester carboxylesterase